MLKVSACSKKHQITSLAEAVEEEVIQLTCPANSTLLGKGDFKNKENYTGLGDPALQAHTQQSDLTLQNPLCFKDNSVGLAKLCFTNRAERLQTGSAGIK